MIYYFVVAWWGGPYGRPETYHFDRLVMMIVITARRRACGTSSRRSGRTALAITIAITITVTVTITITITIILHYLSDTGVLD